MKKLFCTFVILPVLLGLLAACNALPDIIQDVPEEVDMRSVERTAEPTPRPTPSCPDVSSFGTLFEYWPGGNTFPSTWKFTWFYSQPPNKANVQEWFDACVPDSYSLYLSTGPDFGDEFEVPVNNPLVGYDITKVTVEWDFDYPLEPMKTYRWVAVGHYGTIDISTDRIALLHDDSRWVGLHPANKGSFRTGPMCGEDSIDIPAILYPADGETISTRMPKLTWDVNTCMPLVFITQLSRLPNLEALDPTFTSFAAADYTFRLQTNYPWLDMNNIGGSPLPQLPDCTTYYWRVIGGVGDYFLYGTERVWGEWSEVYSFTINSGACPTPTPTAIPTRVPTLTPTASPLPEPVSCSSFKDQVSCESHTECYWHIYPPTQFKLPVCEKKP